MARVVKIAETEIEPIDSPDFDACQLSVASKEHNIALTRTPNFQILLDMYIPMWIFSIPSRY